MADSDWNIFLSVARHGSTLAASRGLRVSQSTVSRRIDALERTLGLRLFDRSPAGYVLTPAGTEMVPRANDIEQAVSRALSTARQNKRRLDCQIRFTTFVTATQTFLPGAIRDFRLAYPDIMVEVAANEARLDLLAGEADVALRVGPAPQEDGLVMRRLMTDGWSVYCSRDYAASQDVPRAPEELASHAIITVSPTVHDFPIVHWFEDAMPSGCIVMRHYDIAGLLAGLKDGVGVGLMSDMMAEAAGLTRCFVPPVTFEAPIWLITTERLQKEPRIRALMDFLSGYMAQKRYRKPAS
jgi:DNA-binding transcriptional LysR family regulator